MALPKICLSGGSACSRRVRGAIVSIDEFRACVLDRRGSHHRSRGGSRRVSVAALGIGSERQTAVTVRAVWRGEVLRDSEA